MRTDSGWGHVLDVVEFLLDDAVCAERGRDGGPEVDAAITDVPVIAGRQWRLERVARRAHARAGRAGQRQRRRRLLLLDGLKRRGGDGLPLRRAWRRGLVRDTVRMRRLVVQRASVRVGGLGRGLGGLCMARLDPARRRAMGRTRHSRCVGYKRDTLALGCRLRQDSNLVFRLEQGPCLQRPARRRLCKLACLWRVQLGLERAEHRVVCDAKEIDRIQRRAPHFTCLETPSYFEIPLHAPRQKFHLRH